MRRSYFLSSVIMLIWMTLLTGIAYPLFVTLFAQLAMHESANGSLVYVNGKAVGSRLIAQQFTDNAYFWPRPSAVDYQTLPAGASNLGPTSIALQKAVTQRRNALGAVDPTSKIPDELLYTSASGVDPHISLEAAYFQAPRIATARGLSSEKEQQKLFALIDKMAEENRYVNVLMLNLALDQTANHNEGL